MANKKKKFLRIVIGADIHAGHVAGLTPPQWQYSKNDKDPKRAKFAVYQKYLWDFYSSVLKELQPIDLFICNGDLIDGKGERTGGIEQFELDRMIQSEMAIECLKEAKAEKYLLTYGTPYHTGKEEDWENMIAKEMNCHIGGHEWVDANGLIFDIKHHITSSSVPYGRVTSVKRDRFWNLLWSTDANAQPKADIIIRSHVHYFEYSGTANYLAITTPALQGFGSKFGTRRCSGLVDIGLLYFDIYDRNNWSWNYKLLNVQSLAPTLFIV